MTQEAYCSFEVSKLLKEKGFDEFCFSSYLEDGRAAFSEVETRYKFPEIARPTHQMACAWLREKHGLHIGLMPYDIEDRKGGSIVRYLPEIYKKPKHGHELEVEGLNVCDSPEEAIESAIKHCLSKI